MESVTSTEGLKLFVQHWQPAGAARGTVQIVHGLGEHSGRYEGVAETLVAAGWRVVAHDLRGHGRSEGPRGGIADSDSMPADVVAVMDAVRQSGPHVLLGHSLGGLIAARFVAERLARIGRQAGLDIAKALAPGELRERHGAELLGARQRAHARIAAMALHDASEAGPRDELHDLREQGLADMHVHPQRLSSLGKYAVLGDRSSNRHQTKSAARPRQCLRVGAASLV